MEINQYDIIVCGDSFCCATDIDLREVGLRAHFSQILEDLYGYRVLNLAHGGVSNTCILFQIKEALNYRPQTIVYNRTFEGRLDLMLNDRFNINCGLKNFLYFDPSMTSYKHGGHAGDFEMSCLSTVHQGLESSPFFSLSAEQLKAVDTWLLHFFNRAKEREQFDWMFEYWHDRMIKSGIQALPFRHSAVGKLAYDFCEHTPNYDTPFHTDLVTQQKIAKNINNVIRQNVNLSWKD